MLKAIPSQVLLSRPISVYKVESLSTEHSSASAKAEFDAGQPDKTPCAGQAACSGVTAKIHFLIMEKGQGTKELCALRLGDSVSVIGALGNTFPESEGFSAIIGGGIGVAPVAGFASTLTEKTYDFYACFRSKSYGLEGVKAKSLVITTDDGTQGIKGMLPDVFTANTIKDKGYTCVYACGPEPMLAYVQKVCGEAGIKCYLSMEARMACGVGACLGCTIPTTEGNRRCCKDGPVFPGEILVFPERKPTKSNAPNSADPRAIMPTKPQTHSEKAPHTVTKPDLSVDICGVKLKNPVIAASGTFGYGSEYSSLIDVNALGGICSKGLTLEARAGNPGSRLVETTGGLINSIGLENPGIRHFIENELPEMQKFNTVILANLSGSSLDTYTQGASLLDKTTLPMIELNISCPNVKAGGMAFGLNPATAAEVTAAVRRETKKPLVVKLSPNAPDLLAVADAVREAGADAISLVNTFQATSIDIERARPVFANIHAGYSGPAIKPIALRMVYDLCRSMKKLPENKQIPVIGLGGIQTWQDAVEFIMAGAHAVQVGTATFSNPSCMEEIISGIRLFMQRKGYTTLADMRGIAL
ncbi:MAG: dihydroorotate dehydrogenase [Treponemataceae bacterium]|nr:dihydroorotate dehydrogenase [Treponemataceae bacterium]